MGCKISIYIAMSISCALIASTYPSIVQAATYISAPKPVSLSSAQTAALADVKGKGKPEPKVLKSMETPTASFPDCHTVTLMGADGEFMTYKVNCQ
jgi:hypothetical protein